MSTWTWRPDVQEVDQGGGWSGRLEADTAGIPLAGVRLRLRFSSYAFQNLDLDPLGFSAPGDEFERIGEDEVLATRAVPVAGVQDLLGFSCEAIGRRGSSYQISAELLEAYDPDGIPIPFPAVTASVRIAPGALGIPLGQALDSASRDEVYGALLIAEGGAPGYVWNHSGGNLPAGLHIGPDGALTGTPAEHGSFNFNATVTDSAGASVEGTFHLEVHRVRPRILLASLPPACMGRRFDLALAIQGGSGGVAWQVAGLPDGLYVSSGRIQGMVARRRDLVGMHTVQITARDALQREATVTLPLLVLPFTEWPIAADTPGAVAVGRNLYVTKYRVTLSTAAHASSGLDSDTQDILEQVKEDLMGDIAELLFEVGASQDPRAREEARGLLTALLGEYRQIDDWTSTEVAVTVAAKVWIDGELVKEIKPEPPFARPKSSAAHPLVVARARKRWRSKPSAAYWPARSRPKALRWGFRYLGAAKETREAMRKEFPRWAEALDVMISEATQLAIDLRGRLGEHWHPLPLDEISLTPGPHRVKVDVSTWAVVIDPGLAPPAVSANATVTIRPVNREVWPRLDHEGVVQVVLGGSGTSSAEHIVDCGESGVDVVYASGQKLWVIAATGKANEPYSAPKAFDGQIDFEPTLLASGQQDDIGRSGLLAGSRQKAVAFVNGGPGGYDKVALDSTGPWEALAFSPVRADGWARALLLRDNALWVGSGLAGSLAWSKNALAPPLFGDAAVRMVAFVDGAGRVVVGLAYFLSGLTRFHLLPADGTLGASVAGPAWGSQDHRRQISALRVGAMEPGGAELLSALRQGRQARWSRMTSSGWTAPASAELPLPVRALAPGPGTAAGALLLLEPDDAAVLLWSAGGVLSMLPIDLAAGAREIDSCERVAAVSSRDADVVRVLMAPETLE